MDNRIQDIQDNKDTGKPSNQDNRKQETLIIPHSLVAPGGPADQVECGLQQLIVLGNLHFQNAPRHGLSHHTATSTGRILNIKVALVTL